MTKQTKQFIGTLILGFVCLIGAVKTIIYDTDLVLKKQNSIIGRVVNYGIATHRTGGRYKRNVLVFYLRLNNSDQNFAVFRDYEEYSDFKSLIKIGDTLKVYFRGSSSDLNLNVFQIESKSKILYYYDTYNKKSSTVAAVSLFAGLFIITLGIIGFTKFSIPKFLTSIVDVKDK